MAAVLSLKDLTLSFGRHNVLDGATFAVEEGEKVGFVGSFIADIQGALGL